MNLTNLDKQHVDEFFKAIEPIQIGYLDNGFSYLAVREKAGFAIVQGKLFLSVSPSTIPHTHFKSENVRAGHYSLAELKLTPREFVERLVSGGVETPDGPLRFLPQENGYHGVYYQPFHSDGLQSNNRFNVLGLVGTPPWSLVKQPDLDWELKAAPIPYDGIADLAQEYQIGTLRTDATNLEIVGFNIAAINLGRRVTGTKAKIGIIMSTAADTQKVSLGYRVFSQGKVIERNTLAGEKLQWSEINQLLNGDTELEVPNAAVVHCIATYNGVAQHQGWIADDSTVQNSRRAVYETFDRQLNILKEVLAREGRAKARDLEAAVSWLLWMSGFSPAHLGGVDRVQEAPDIILTAPNGHFALVECTTGLLKADNKLSLLHDRALAVRRALELSNSRHLRVLPAIVTNKAREEIRPDLEQAERWGILVITRENLESFVDRTLVLPQADELYQQAEKDVQNAMAKYEAQPALPLGSIQ